MANAQTLTLPIAGLSPDPGPFALPPGALVEAQNIAYRRAGVLEPRGEWFCYHDLSLIAGVSKCRGIFKYDDGEVLATHWLGDRDPSVPDPLWRVDYTRYQPTDMTYTFTEYLTHFTSMQGRGFFTSDQGVVELDSNANTATARLAGVPRAPGFLTELFGTSGFLSPGQITAYRLCVARPITRTDGSTFYILGEPSEVRTQASPIGTSGTRSVRLTIWLTADIKAGDVIQIYRLPTITGVSTPPFLIGDPPDEGVLRAQIPISAAEIMAIGITFDDMLPDAQLSGAKLYTNASQQGIEMSNARPGYARDVAHYNGMMFYGGSRSPQRVTLRLVGTGVPEDSSTNPKTNGTTFANRLIGVEATSVTAVTAGSAVVTPPASDLPFYSVGQYINAGAGSGLPEAAGLFPANTQIQSIGISTITMNKAATAGGSLFLHAFDWIEVDDGTTKRRIYTRYGFSLPPPNPTASKLFAGTDEYHTTQQTTPDGPYSGGAPDMERSWARAYENVQFRLKATASGTVSNADIVLVIERLNASQAQFTVRSSKPAAFDVRVDSATGVKSAQDDSPGTLRWSKLDEPEACPIPYSNDLGDSAQPIMRIVPTQDAIYILKTDGLFRCYGDAPNDLSFAPVDPTARISPGLPNASTRYGDSVFAWTTRGMVEIGSFGCRNIDAPIYQAANGPLQPLLAAPSAFAFGSSLGRWIAFGHSADPDAYWTVIRELAWVYHPEYNAWSTWTFPFTPQAASSNTYTAKQFQYPLAVFGFDLGYADYYDYDGVEGGGLPLGFGDIFNETVNVTAVSGGTTWTLAPSIWIPEVGDTLRAVLDPKEIFYVVEVISATQVRVNKAASVGTGVGEYDPTKSFAARIVWVANPAGNPATDKHYTDSELLFRNIRCGREFSEIFEGYQNPVEIDETVSYDPTQTEFLDGKPYAHRGHVPVEVSRDWALKFGFEFKQAGAFFSCVAAALTYSETGNRVGKVPP